MRYEIIESKHWKHVSGRTASIFGSVPYVNDADAENWQIVIAGWTVRDNRSGTVGIGRKPFQTREEAQAFADKFNS
jgi:hypothetical protein